MGVVLNVYIAFWSNVLQHSKIRIAYVALTNSSDMTKIKSERCSEGLFDSDISAIVHVVHNNFAQLLMPGFRSSSVLAGGGEIISLLLIIFQSTLLFKSSAKPFLWYCKEHVCKVGKHRLLLQVMIKLKMLSPSAMISSPLDSDVFVRLGKYLLFSSHDSIPLSMSLISLSLSSSKTRIHIAHHHHAQKYNCGSRWPLTRIK